LLRCAIIRLTMAEPVRTTSFAKGLEGLHQETNAIDRARALRDQFVQSQERASQQTQRETEKSGSQMIKQDAPVFRPAPSGPMRAPDRQIRAAEFAKEHRVEDRKIEAAKVAHELKARQNSQDKERDRER